MRRGDRALNYPFRHGNRLIDQRKDVTERKLAGGHLDHEDADRVILMLLRKHCSRREPVLSVNDPHAIFSVRRHHGDVAQEQRLPPSSMRPADPFLLVGHDGPHALLIDRALQ